MSDNPQPRIFISSLMQGYGAVRDASAAAIRRAGCEPVRAEDFPAATTSPRTACLDGVASCDGFLLILGARYLSPGGELTAAGMSATEEEYREAIRRKKQTFVFLDQTDRQEAEPRQATFIRDVTGYVDGHWRKTFRSLDDLGQLIEQALREAQPMIATENVERSAGRRLNDAFDARPAEAQDIVWMQVAWTTLRDEEVIDPLLLLDSKFQRQVQLLAHEGEVPLFDFSQPKQPLPEAARLRLVQGDAEEWREARDLVVVDLYENGTLSVTSNVTSLESDYAHNHDIAAGYRIDPDQVRHRLVQGGMNSSAVRRRAPCRDRST